MNADIAVLYSTGSGHTELVAKHLAKGIEEIARVQIIDVRQDFDIEDLHKMDGLVFGSPTYMGSADSHFKGFMDATSKFWTEQPWKDKVAAGFTVGGCPSGDKLMTLVQLAVFAAQHGMIWVGQSELGDKFSDSKDRRNCDGFWMGLGASSISDKNQKLRVEDLLTAELFGKRIAAITTTFKRGQLEYLNVER
ncbi:MAG: flavodoxin family protein [Oligoflexales bacterium]